MIPLKRCNGVVDPSLFTLESKDALPTPKALAPPPPAPMCYIVNAGVEKREGDVISSSDFHPCDEESGECKKFCPQPVSSSKTGTSDDGIEPVVKLEKSRKSTVLAQF
jgi:hypothetical protein